MLRSKDVLDHYAKKVLEYARSDDKGPQTVWEMCLSLEPKPPLLGVRRAGVLYAAVQGHLA